MMTLREVAKELRVSEWTVRKWLKQGRLPGYRLGTKAGWRIKEKDLEEFLSKIGPEGRKTS